MVVKTLILSSPETLDLTDDVLQQVTYTAADLLVKLLDGVARLKDLEDSLPQDTPYLVKLIVKLARSK